MNLEIILALKQRAKEMLENNYSRKIEDEELYTIICEWENCYKEKEIYRKTNNEHAKGVLDIEKPYKELLDDSIPKSVIREKIDKLEDSLWEKGYEDEKSYAIKVLKKILEDKK